MKLQSVGKLLCLVALLGSACKTTEPPPIPIYIHDGLGGADGHEPGDPTDRYKAPSELKNWWMTDQESMAKFAAWCYRVDSEEVAKIMAEMQSPKPSPKPLVTNDASE